MSEGVRCRVKLNLGTSLNLLIIVDLRDLCQMLRQTTQKPLCHLQPALAILTMMYEAPPEAHSVRQAHEALYKDPL